MTDFNVTADSAAWRSHLDERLRAAYATAGYPAEAVAQRLEQLRAEAAEATVVELSADGRPVGHLAVTVREEADGIRTGRIDDLWAEPAHEPAARAWVERWCAERGATRLRVRLFGPAGVFADYPVRGQLRIKHIAEPPEPVDGVTGRPMAEEEYGRWFAAQHDGYVADIVRSGSLTPEQAREKSERDHAELLPDGFASQDHSFHVMEAGGEPIGTGWLKHRFLPGITYGYSLEVHPQHRGKGFGRAAMVAGERATLAAGDSALMFNVFGGNTVAMGLYDATGYRVVEEFRSIELPAAAATGGC